MWWLNIWNFQADKASPVVQLQKKTAVAQVRAEKIAFDKASKLVIRDTEKRRRENLSIEEKKAENAQIAQEKVVKKALREREYNEKVSSARLIVAR
jgi:hypothetical protein